MKIETKKRLHDAWQACEAILEFVEGIDFEGYLANPLMRPAVERQFEIAGEALRCASDSEPTLRTELPDMRYVIALRNRIVHGYDTIDHCIIWGIVQQDLPSLAKRLTEILGESTPPV